MLYLPILYFFGTVTSFGIYKFFKEPFKRFFLRENIKDKYHKSCEDFTKKNYGRTGLKNINDKNIKKVKFNDNIEVKFIEK